jgi:choline monooxygenase
MDPVHTPGALSDFLTEADLAAIRGPVENARGLPGRAYGAEFYALEQQRLFPRSWCAVAFASEIPEPGDAQPVELAGWPLLLVRGPDRELRGFLNICRHRAMRVVPEPRQGLGALSCPWHGWTYDLKGKLTATPRVGGERIHDDPRICREDIDLKPVRIAQWLDLVFVNIDGNAPAFEEHIRPVAALLENYALDDLHPDEDWTLDYPGNWKVAVEGAIEDYHLPSVHPQLLSGQSRLHPRADSARGCFMAVSSAYAISSVGTGEVEPPSLIRPDQEGIERSFFMILFPTGSLWTRPDQIGQGLWLPQGPDRTRLRYRHYYPRHIGLDPAYAQWRREVATQFQQVLAQDIPFVQFVHSNTKFFDAAGIRPRFSPYWECNLHEFQRSVVDVLEG